MALDVGIVKPAEVEEEYCLEKLDHLSEIANPVLWERQVFDWLAFEPQPLPG